MDLGVACGFVDKSGAWYSCSGEKIGQGKDNAREYLREHPKLAKELEAKIREKLLKDDSVIKAKVTEEELADA